MSNLKGPEVEASDHINNNTSESGSRQEGKLSQTWIRAFIRTTSSFGLWISSLVLPVDAPINVNAQSNTNQQSPYTLLVGDGGLNKLNVLLERDIGSGATPEMVWQTSQDIAAIPQLFFTPPDTNNEYIKNINIFTAEPQFDFNCNGYRGCEDKAYKGEGKRALENGYVFHKIWAVVASPDGNLIHGGRSCGGKFVEPPHDGSPAISAFSFVIRPMDAWNSPLTKKVVRGAVAQEFFGSIACLGDNTGGVMSGESDKFIAEHTQKLWAEQKLWNFKWQLPANEIIAYGVSSTTSSTQSPDMSIQLSLKYPEGTTQMYVEGIPSNNDGPAITAIVNAQPTFKVEAPKIGVGNYNLLPGQTYTWTEYSTAAKVPLQGKDDPNLRQYEGFPGKFFPTKPAEIKIRMPDRPSGLITAFSPQPWEEIHTRPTIRWVNGYSDVFYYEFQLSEDCTFNTDPNTAIASVTEMLIHGGLTNPLNSYTPKDDLRPGADYCWRVRARQQGDAKQMDWSQIFRFSTKGLPGLKSN